MEIFYQNGKGESKALAITEHARTRLRERWQRVYDYLGEEASKHPSGLWGPAFVKFMNEGDTDTVIAFLMTRARRFAPSQWGKGRKQRNRNYDSAIYFRSRPFDLIIQNCSLTTIELSDGELRFMNNK